MARNASYICNVVFQCILGRVMSPMKSYDKHKYYCRHILEILSPIGFLILFLFTLFTPQKYTNYKLLFLDVYKAMNISGNGNTLHL